jgi:hypothetical protein
MEVEITRLYNQMCRVGGFMRYRMGSHPKLSVIKSPASARAIPRRVLLLGDGFFGRDGYSDS